MALNVRDRFSRKRQLPGKKRIHLRRLLRLPPPRATARLKLPYSMLAADGRLEVRVTRKRQDIIAAQELRYLVFYEELGASATRRMAAKGRDFDEFDGRCDHLLVIDHNRPKGESVVGTYRILRHEVAIQYGGFYSATEYDIMPLVANIAGTGELMELGRSCVHPDYRTNWVIQLLWRGLAGYIQAYEIKYMFGCASLPGTDPTALKLPLSFLYHEYLAPRELMAHALPERYVDMNLMAQDEIDRAAARKSLPPLIKAYLRLGAFIGDGAVIDRQFGTTDVFIVLPLDRIADKYHEHFERGAAAAPAE
ncbi:MAG: GNAT family N-acetyltransferase [Proteobacteria bacterium]|nr:GNAT family N-acetyltransferase [Pseudomonadota bacterium]